MGFWVNPWQPKAVVGSHWCMGSVRHEHAGDEAGDMEVKFATLLDRVLKPTSGTVWPCLGHCLVFPPAHAWVERVDPVALHRIFGGWYVKSTTCTVILHIIFSKTWLVLQTQLLLNATIIYHISITYIWSIISLILIVPSSSYHHVPPKGSAASSSTRRPGSTGPVETWPVAKSQKLKQLAMGKPRKNESLPQIRDRLTVLKRLYNRFYIIDSNSIEIEKHWERWCVLKAHPRKVVSQFQIMCQLYVDTMCLPAGGQL